MKTTANRSYNSSTPVQGSNATSDISNPVQGSIVPSNTTSGISILNPVVSNLSTISGLRSKLIDESNPAVVNTPGPHSKFNTRKVSLK